MTNKSDPDFERAAGMLHSSEHVVFISHEFTDGDDLGAMLALRYALAYMGKKCTPVARGGVPDSLLFLPGIQDIQGALPDGNFDSVIFFGCGEPSRIGFPADGLLNRHTLNIDHHPDNKYFADINLVDPAAAATCELVYYFINWLNVPLTKQMAVCLLTGIFNDTGGFRHANTTAKVFEIAADLMRRGAHIDRISEHYFGKSELPKLRAWAKALENARFDPIKKMVYSVITEEELAEVGAGPDDLEGIAEILNTVPEANYSMVLKQRGDEIKGSLRSENYKGVNVSSIARSFGGGGHKLAAGFKLKGKIERTPDGWKIT